MTVKHPLPGSPLRSVAITLVMILSLSGWTACGQEPTSPDIPPPEEASFQEVVQPLLEEYCLRCHNADRMEAGKRLDQLDGALEDQHLFLWQHIQYQLLEGAMPPEDEPQLGEPQRQLLLTWIERAMAVASKRNAENNGSARRLTVTQYRNTLRDLLQLNDDLTEVLPPEAVSKDGFQNNARAMVLSPLLLESYFDIARKSLDLCIVDEQATPVIQNFRVDLGASTNANPCPDELILGAHSILLKNPDYQVTELAPPKPFDYRPFKMRTAYRFIEGYEGNATVRGWREFDSIYHAVFACMRGSGIRIIEAGPKTAYPKGRPYQTIPEGVLLRPAIPSLELFGLGSTYGPFANFKISLRELPDHGNFRVTVRATRYDDVLLLDPDEPISVVQPQTICDLSPSSPTELTIEEAGIYQVDVHFLTGEQAGVLSLEWDGRNTSGWLLQPDEANKTEEEVDAPVLDHASAFMLARLPAGPLTLHAHYEGTQQLRRVVFSRVEDDSPLLKRFEKFKQRVPLLGVHVGLRRDCGSTLRQVGEIRRVGAGQLQEFVFEGAIHNYPSPDVEKNNVNYLAGIQEIGVRSEYTDGRDMPRLLIRSVEFEGPYHEIWPPATHRNIFIDSANRNNRPAYARQIIRSFASRAFRRPVTAAEENTTFDVWQRAYADTGDFQQSVKDALLVVLTSPQFLFLTENSAGPEPEQLDPYELASKLSYFLWNTAPDGPLLDLAAADALHMSLDGQVTRMIADRRFVQFIEPFTSQWLRLDKFDVVKTDREQYPQLTRDTKRQLRQEPLHFLRYVIEQNLPLENLVRSDFILANDVVARYYGLHDRSETGFQFLPVSHRSPHLGGLLSQASILAGLSDGRQSNPVKRGAWLARKIIAEPPDDPPPNVPQLNQEDNPDLSLREQLEQHRHQTGCANCHAGIDPWGLPFEQFDAGGRVKASGPVETHSTLPDGTPIEDFNGLKTYLAGKRLDRVAFSFLKHLTSYALGRSLNYNELAFLEQEALKLKPGQYPAQDLLRLVIHSELFLEK